MKDLSNPLAIKLKGILFLLTGMLAATLLLLESADVENGRVAGPGSLELLPLLLFRVLRHRKIRRSELPFCRIGVAGALPGSARQSALNGDAGRFAA